ncbi:MAG: cytochrome P450 [Actinobacteria bacterium]|jgi:cytochrome P450|nr:cytochrome P450 [Actinomycetota bacterium]NCX51800.1 cytochrome P450 [Actinomycetota bacterium]NCZ61030.1 cytochrome P450 [Actinomycetota bacterium]NDA44409.1 cytochrome P450 [Actinomycetota bacterium]NDC16677.1 cytochrome P450 [Actinomycetota bacterium]
MIDFNNPTFVADPYEQLKELRQFGKPVWHEGMQIFLAARHSDANDVFRNKSLGRIFTDKKPDFEWETFNWLHSDSILDSEPPKHTRLRSLVAKAFNRNKIEGMRPAVERITHKLLDAINEKVKSGTTFDLIADYAEPLPVKIIADLLGFPESEEHLLRPWSQSIVKMYEVNPSEQHQVEAKKAAAEFAEYVRSLAEHRKKNPGQDLITDLAMVEENGEKLNSHELVATCVLLLNAGHEASVNAFGNGMVAVLERPDQADLLRKNSRAITQTALEEFMRFDAPLHLFERTATVDTEVGGVKIERGQKIAALIGSANRDSEVFERADEMDLTRDPNPHIGFGAGIHFCLGAPLARLEMSVSLPALWEKYPNMQLAENPVRRPTFVLRGYERVSISV